MGVRYRDRFSIQFGRTIDDMEKLDYFSLSSQRESLSMPSTPSRKWFDNEGSALIFHTLKCSDDIFANKEESNLNPVQQ